MSECQEIGWSRIATADGCSPPTPAVKSDLPIHWNLGTALREIVGGWVVCGAIAAACFGLLVAAAPARDGRTAALISLDRTATVASATDRLVDTDRHGRC
jgi:hypothetical protein